MPLSLEKLSLINISIFHELLTLSLLQIAHKLSFIGITIMWNHFSISSCPVVYELSLINISISEDKFSIAVHFILKKSSLIDILIGPSILSFSLHNSFVHLSFIYVSVFEVIFPNSMLLSIACFPFINTIIILYGFFDELKCVGNFFLTKNFFGKILKLPENYFVSSICYFVSWNIRKFAISE